MLLTLKTKTATYLTYLYKLPFSPPFFYFLICCFVSVNVGSDNCLSQIHSGPMRVSAVTDRLNQHTFTFVLKLNVNLEYTLESVIFLLILITAAAVMFAH